MKMFVRFLAFIKRTVKSELGMHFNKLGWGAIFTWFFINSGAYALRVPFESMNTITWQVILSCAVLGFLLAMIFIMVKEQFYAVMFGFWLMGVLGAVVLVLPHFENFQPSPFVGEWILLAIGADIVWVLLGVAVIHWVVHLFIRK